MGGIALTDGPVGVFVNPATLQRIERNNAMIGYSMLRNDLAALPDVRWDTNQDGRVDGTDDPLAISSDYGRSDGMQIAIGRNIGPRIGVAFNAFMPTDRLIDISAFEPAIPTWFMYEDRQRRFEMGIGFGWEQLPGVNLGGTVQMLSRARFRATGTLSASVRGAEEGDTEATDLVSDVTLDFHEMTLDIEPAISPMIGLFWDVGELVEPLDGLQLGATWRGPVGRSCWRTPTRPVPALPGWRPTCRGLTARTI